MKGIDDDCFKNNNDKRKKDYIWIWCWALVLVMLLPLVDVVNDPILVQKSIEIPWFNAFLFTFCFIFKFLHQLIAVLILFRGLFFGYIYLVKFIRCMIYIHNRPEQRFCRIYTG